MTMSDSFKISSPVYKYATWGNMPTWAFTGMRNYYGWWTHPWAAIPNLLTMKREINASWKEIIENVRYVRGMSASPVQYTTGLSTFCRAVATSDIKKKLYALAGPMIGLINGKMT
jgi:hypothetical protein